MELTGINDLVFSDRYALKDPYRQFASGDKVVVIVSRDGEWEKREVGKIKSVNKNQKTAVVILNSGEEIERPFSVMDKVLEKSPEDMWNRMAKWLSLKEGFIEKDSDREYYNLLKDFNFVPGGRIMATLGSEELSNYVDMPEGFDGLDSTILNCFVFQVKPQDSSHGCDSREAIMDTMKEMVMTLSAGGGTGIPLSILRPNASHIRGVNGKSSGAVSWGSLFSDAASNVSQGGSRRGAVLLGLDVSHPDVVEFIFSKVRPSEIPGIKEKWQPKFKNANFVAHGIECANISVFISDEFMEAVKQDKDWDLIFPDYESMDKEVYNSSWDGDIKAWVENGFPIKVYDTVRARDLWDCIMESAWRSAEPGVIFLDRMNKMYNGAYFSKLICTNPLISLADEKSL